MKKTFLFALVVCAVVMSSCKLAIVPKAVNSVNSVKIDGMKLNLDRKDYQVLKTISAEASICYHQYGKRRYTISDRNGDFKVSYKHIPYTTNFGLDKFQGIAQYGFLTNDYQGQVQSINDMSPEDFARHFATYRLINACKMAGGDGVIEPVYCMRVGQEGRDIIFTVTVSAKVVKLNTDK
ncbi:MAG: hypothetical protein MJZ92_04820 [Paludibacteraceae bacterium]|nr:hypothetical protein [Paludibacteraceae bacterium]